MSRDRSRYQARQRLPCPRVVRTEFVGQRILHCRRPPVPVWRPGARSLSTSGGSGPKARLVGALVRTRAERFDLRDSVHRWHTDAPHEPRPGQAKGDTTGASLRAFPRDLLSAAVAPRGMGRRPTFPCRARDARAPALQSQACPQAARHRGARRARTRGESRAIGAAVSTQARTAETQGLPGCASEMAGIKTTSPSSGRPSRRRK